MEQSVSSSVAKAAKPLLWIGMVSMAMAFAGLTSGYVVARSALVAKGQWVEVPLPRAFWASTAFVLLGSFLVHRALRAAQEDRVKQVNSLLLAAVGVGLLFLVSLADGSCWDKDTTLPAQKVPKQEAGFTSSLGSTGCTL